MVSAIIIIIIAVLLVAGLAVGGWFALRSQRTTPTPPPERIQTRRTQQPSVTSTGSGGTPPATIDPDAIKHGDIVRIRSALNNGGYIGKCDVFPTVATIKPVGVSLRITIENGSPGQVIAPSDKVRFQDVSSDNYLTGGVSTDFATQIFGPLVSGNDDKITTEFLLSSTDNSPLKVDKNLFIQMYPLGNRLVNILRALGDTGRFCPGSFISFTFPPPTPGTDQWIIERSTAIIT